MNCTYTQDWTITIIFSYILSSCGGSNLKGRTQPNKNGCGPPVGNPLVFAIKYTIYLWHHYKNGAWLWHNMHSCIFNHLSLFLVLSFGVWLVSGLWIGRFFRDQSDSLHDNRKIIHCLRSFLTLCLVQSNWFLVIIKRKSTNKVGFKTVPYKFQGFLNQTLFFCVDKKCSDFFTYFPLLLSNGKVFFCDCYQCYWLLHLN